MKPYMPVVADILNARKPKRILDAPSGSGWLRSMLRFERCIFLTLAGYENIRLHDLPQERKPRHFYERILAVPQRTYCRNKAKKASSAEEGQFWQDAGSDQSTLGRRLVVSATSKQWCIQ